MKLFYGEIFPKVVINNEEQQHLLKVLRMKDGEEIFVTDGKGNLAKGNLIIDGKKTNLNPVEIHEKLPDFSRKLHIAIAPTKNINRTEFFFEKAIELGVSEITFLQTENSERKNIRFDRFEKQVIAAAKQSLRFHFPEINDLTKLSHFIENVSPENTFVAHCNENLKRSDLKSLENIEELTILIGPEGDFSNSEIEMLSKKGIRAISLGKQRLRTETAGIFVAAWNYCNMF